MRKDALMYKYKGKEYTTKELSVILGLSVATVYRYINRGIHPENIRETFDYKNRTVEYKGKKMNVSDFVKLTGLKKTTITGRFDRKLSGEEIVNFEASFSTKIDYDNISVTIYGVKMTLREIHTIYKLKLDNLYTRYMSGKRGEDLLDVKSIRRNITVNHFGIKRLLKDIAKEEEIDYSTLFNRYLSGDRDQMLVRHVKKQNRKNGNKLIELDGKYYTMKELAEMSGIVYGTIKYRVRRGAKGKDIIRPLHTKSKTKGDK